MSNSYYDHKRFLVIAPTRSGGTMLCHALDSHPEIYCHRGEPLHRQDPIRMIADSPFTAIDTCLRMQGYTLAGCKLTYSQFKTIGLESIEHIKPHKVIHLYRQNALKRLVSDAVRLQDKNNGLQAHTREARDLQKIVLSPERTLHDITEYWADVKMFSRFLYSHMGDSNYFDVTYEGLTTFQHQINRELAYEMQRFLGVSSLQSLTFGTVKRNPFPLKDIIENYDEVYEYMQKHAYNYLDYFRDES